MAWSNFCVMFCVALIKHTLQLTFLLCGEKIEVNDEKKLEVEGPVRDDGGVWPGLVVVEMDRIMTHFSGWFYRICSRVGYWQRRKWRIKNEPMILPLLLLLFGRLVVSALFDPVDCSTPGFPALHHLPELAQTHVHWVSDAIQPTHPLSSPFPPAFSLSQHQGLS